jgi:hypothetical protein
VEGAGFEPAKAEPADLQSAPVDRLGTPPPRKPSIVRLVTRTVNSLEAIKGISFQLLIGTAKDSDSKAFNTSAEGGSPPQSD